ncbi:MAG: hypothetical protein ACI9WC_002189 [Arenicella sp.]|jgi:transposase
MLKIKYILRLHYQVDLSARQIARSLNVSRSVVSKYLIRERGGQLSWPLPSELAPGFNILCSSYYTKVAG